jgi:hypothetical protein
MECHAEEKPANADAIGGFARGQEHGHHGWYGPRPRFSRGQERYGHDADETRPRFSRGQEREPLTPEEKHRGDFAEGQRRGWAPVPNG